MNMNKPVSGRNQDILRIKKSGSGAVIGGGTQSFGIQQHIKISDESVS
jgi:hypothetical protein